MYVITEYEVINGKRHRIKMVEDGRCKTMAEVKAYEARLQKREQYGRKHEVTVFVNYTNLAKPNPKSDNIGKHNFKLKKWTELEGKPKTQTI